MKNPPIRHHLAEDTIDRRDMDALAAWLKTYPRLTKGPLALEFEARWSRWLGARRSAFCNSGSSANLLMYAALLESGRLRSRKVVVPAVGWATTVAPAFQLGLEPHACEADPETFGLELNHLESLLKKHRPGAVVLVHVLGVPHRMEEMLALKRKYGFALLEDSCAAVGASYRGRKVGSFGDMGSFSFYFGHQISTIEGGMVSTSDPELHDLLMMLRSHGWSKDLPRSRHEELVRRHRVDDFHSPFVFYLPGYNLRSTDLNAFLGLRQMDKIERIIAARRERHELYRSLLGGLFLAQKPPPGSVVCSISFGLLAEDEAQRRRVVSALVREGVETRIFSAGDLTRHPFWRARRPAARLPMAERIHRTGFFLPNNPSLPLRDVEKIARIVREAA